MSRILDEYKLLRRIGEGGMATVYEAKHLPTGDLVAVKKLMSKKAKNDQEKKRDIIRFKNELKTLRQIDSQYVMKFIDADFESVEKYIVMELIDGIELKTKIRESSRLNVDEVVEIAKQLALGFDAIHKANVVHRDIKSSNIMISDHGQVKIIDFGIAVSEETQSVTRTDNVIGSVFYMAPELLSRIEPSAQSDIYSLGVLMYEMIVGEAPFKAKTAAETALMHRNNRVPWLNKVQIGVPQAFANVVRKATQQDPSRRYSDMYQFYQDISTSLSRDRLYEAPYNPTDRAPITFMSFVTSKWFLVGMLVFFIIILIAAAIAITVVVSSV